VKTYIQSSRQWECGNPEGISKECGKEGWEAGFMAFHAFHTLSIHGLLFARQMHRGHWRFGISPEAFLTRSAFLVTDFGFTSLAVV
jgi:hypothetical protein